VSFQPVWRLVTWGPVYEHILPGGCLLLPVIKSHVSVGLESMYPSLLFLCLAWVLRKCCIYPIHKLHACFCFLFLNSGVSRGYIDVISPGVELACVREYMRGTSSELELHIVSLMARVKQHPPLYREGWMVQVVGKQFSFGFQFTS
jgi:hypothetical protein